MIGGMSIILVLSSLHLMNTISITVTASFCKINNAKRPQSEITRSNTNSKNNNININDPFILPIFPLRKSVKLPTESITLNLYEDRYLALSEFVLKSDGSSSSDNGQSKMFGGLYCSDKVQIVKNGVGPIVPIVEPGDVGVVCKVVYSAEALIPTTTNDNDRKRRIKLEGFAVGRFRVERILHNGYGTSFVEGEEARPFILAIVVRVDDTLPLCQKESLKINKLEQQLVDRIKGRADIASDRVTWNFDNAGDEDEVIRASLSPLLFFPGVFNNNKKQSAYDEAILSWECVELQLDEHRRQQLFSFAMISLVSSNKEASELLKIIRCQSTYERLQYVETCLNKSRWLWWN